MQSEDDKKRLVEQLKILAPEAATAGVVIAIEHTLRGDEAARLLDEVNSPFVGDYWDMANCMSLGYDPLEEIGMLGKHIARVHAKECEKAKVTSPRAIGSYPGLNTVPFGSGDVPVKAGSGRVEKRRLYRLHHARNRRFRRQTAIGQSRVGSLKASELICR